MKGDIDRKYRIEGGWIRKISTGEFLPEDEPLIIFRAKDKLSVPMMLAYAELCRAAGCDAGQLELLYRRIADFLAWQKDHPELMKIPSSEPGDRYR
jgi:hypothetical protein